MSKQRNNLGMGKGHMGMNSVEKPKEFKKTFKRLMDYLKPHGFKFLLVFIFAIISCLFTIYSPIILGNATDSLFNSFINKTAVNFPYIYRIIIVLSVFFVLSSVFRFFQQSITAKISSKVAYVMRKQMDTKLGTLPIKYYDSKTHGEILSRFTNDVDTVGNNLNQVLSQIISSIVTLVGIFVMMLTLSIPMTFVTMLTIPLSIIATAFIAKFSQKHFKAQQDIMGELNGHVEEMVGGQQIVNAYGYEEKSIEKFINTNDRLFSHSMYAQFISGLIMPAIKFISNLGYVAIAILGGLFALKGSMTVGNIQSFIMYTKQFNQPIMQTAQLSSILQSTIAAAERVFELLDETEEHFEGEKIIESCNGKIEFKDVNFSYDSSKPLIQNLNITANKGDIVAIVGKTGAGKTTLVNLLMEFYKVNSGGIYIDDINILDIQKDNLYSMMGMVLQDTWLFSGSIFENIVYGKQDATKEDVIEASKLAHAHGFIKRLPKGYDTLINEEGSNLSIGQKQLITIARALLKDPHILILDEATSSVDTRTESLIQKAMETLMKGRTSFIIAHRLSTIKNANNIIVMDEGKIVEQGNHKELLSQKGYYASLFNSQFDN